MWRLLWVHQYFKNRYMHTVFKISAGPQTLTGKTGVGPAGFPSLPYINFGKIVLRSGKFQILFWRLCIYAHIYVIKEFNILEWKLSVVSKNQQISGFFLTNKSICLSLISGGTLIFLVFQPFSGKAGIFQIDASATDALAPRVVRSSATMVLTTQDKQVIAFNEEGFLWPVPSQCQKMTENTNRILCFLKNKANLRDLIAATGLVILLKLDSNHRFFNPCDLEIWWTTPQNNRAPLLCYFKLFASFRSHWWIKTGYTVRKRPIWVKINDFFTRVTLKFDGWPSKTIGHLFYATSSFVQHFIAIGEFKLELLSRNA